MADRKAYGQPQQGAEGFARTMKCFGQDVALATTDLALNATVALFTVPAGFVVTSISATVPDLDTGTPALTFDIGDAGVADRLIAAATTGQAGGTTTTLASTGLLYQYLAETEIVWKTHAAAATAAAGTVKVRIFGYIA